MPLRSQKVYDEKYVMFLTKKAEGKRDDRKETEQKRIAYALRTKGEANAEG